MSGYVPELEFSRKHDLDYPKRYLLIHQDGLARRLSHWREAQLARRALELAGDPGVVLDLPCGAGRFWPMLCEQPEREIFAADISEGMLATARAAQPDDVVSRISTFQTSAFAIDLGDDAVDCIFCIRLLHHIESSGHRLSILREFHRVSRDAVIVSLWVDGNYKAWKHRRLEARRIVEGRSPQSRFIIARAMIEEEFEQAGFHIADRLDFLPGYAMWRTYVLRKKA